MYQKIKWDGSQVTLVWADKPTAKRSESHELTSSEEPPPEFLSALSAFRPWVLKCLGVSAEAMGLEADPTRLDIRGVTRSTGDQGGCVVTALLSTSVASSPMVLNTPFVPEQGSEGARSLPDDVLDALVNLDRWAARYHKGERAQSDMFAASAEADAGCPTEGGYDLNKTGEELPPPSLALQTVAALAPREGGSIDSVTLTAGGTSVTLTKEHGDRARRELKLMKKSPKPIACTVLDPRD